jgi:toxin-antitoxin system PIN domain toxin
MTLFFPDLNVWLALSVASHSHHAEAWHWLRLLPREVRLIFARYTQVGLLRLLTNQAVMDEQTLSLGQAWSVYERWISDPRVEFYPEPRGMDAAFREATAPLAAKPASKWVGDCYLLAYAQESQATLVTFDRPLVQFARKHGYAAIVPG